MKGFEPNLQTGLLDIPIIDAVVRFLESQSKEFFYTGIMEEKNKSSEVLEHVLLF